MIYERTTLDGKRFAYDAETGLIYWWARKAGVWKQTGKALCQGRPIMKFGGQTNYVHRVAWWVVYGAMPKEIDHINHDLADNRLANLREVKDRGENMRNYPMPRTNTSGVMGVSWHKRLCKWQVQMWIGGKNRKLGYFVNFDDAVKARREAEANHGFHHNHGKPRKPRAEIHPTDSIALGGAGSDEPHEHQLKH